MATACFINTITMRFLPVLLNQLVRSNGVNSNKKRFVTWRAHK